MAASPVVKGTPERPPSDESSIQMSPPWRPTIRAGDPEPQAAAPGGTIAGGLAAMETVEDLLALSWARFPDRRHRPPQRKSPPPPGPTVSPAPRARHSGERWRASCGLAWATRSGSTSMLPVHSSPTSVLCSASAAARSLRKEVISTSRNSRPDSLDRGGRGRADRRPTAPPFRSPSLSSPRPVARPRRSGCPREQVPRAVRGSRSADSGAHERRLK